MNNDFSSILMMAFMILMSAYFSATETAFSSLNRPRLRAMAEKGNKKAERTLDLAEQYDRLLSTILIGNNIVNIAVASMGTIFFVKHFGDIGATLSTIVVTLVVLIFGEISPKSLAKESPERFAMLSTPFLRILMRVFQPLNYLFSLWKRLLSRLFRVSEESRMTQDELLVLVDEAEEGGGIDEEEGELLRSAIEFTEREAEDILTPRVDLEGVSVEADLETVARIFSSTQYSRLLVYENSIDKIVGVIHQKNFYRDTGITEKPIREIMTDPIYVPKHIKISSLLKMLQKNKSHIAVVSDDFGGTLGIVTMEDILEELVGEIYDEHDEVVESFRKVGENCYRILCSEDLKELYDFFDLHGEAQNTTIGGWVLSELERIPNVGDSFRFEDLEVRVTRTDHKRILEIEVEHKNNLL
ncbi:MAG: HlyC/CorC family transporter [Clostridiales bacterium]|nr:HlyC/CorC family transporter [Clostridiales bacterium]